MRSDWMMAIQWFPGLWFYGSIRSDEHCRVIIACKGYLDITTEHAGNWHGPGLMSATNKKVKAALSPCGRLFWNLLHPSERPMTERSQEFEDWLKEVIVKFNGYINFGGKAMRQNEPIRKTAAWWQISGWGHLQLGSTPLSGTGAWHSVERSSGDMMPGSGIQFYAKTSQEALGQHRTKVLIYGAPLLGNDKLHGHDGPSWLEVPWTTPLSLRRRWKLQNSKMTAAVWNIYIYIMILDWFGLPFPFWLNEWINQWIIHDEWIIHE